MLSSLDLFVINASDHDVLEIFRLVFPATVAIIQDPIFDLTRTPDTIVNLGYTNVVLSIPWHSGAMGLETNSVSLRWLSSFWIHFPFDHSPFVGFVFTAAF